MNEHKGDNMDVGPVITNLYRLRFRQILADRARRQAANEARDDVLFADLYISRDRGIEERQPPAPQGIGEYKHAATEVDRDEQVLDTTDLVKQPEAKTDNWQAESALKYVVGSGIGPSVNVRRQMESRVRAAKREGAPCPHTLQNGTCSALFIRCGDRAQYAVGESVGQRKLPHKCLYRPGKRGDYILVVDDDRAVREFCKNSFELFFEYESDKIIPLDNGYKAIDTINRFKMTNRQCGLVVADIDIPGINGYDLVNELYNRNINAEIILMKDKEDHIPKPSDYAGDREIVPDHTFVAQTLKKPFHSAAFVDTIRSMDLGVFG
ncbi:MAG: response regulator [Chitinivibrionales bacterium]|nr:response regulator [Chitinivibrionales bacterium]